MESPPGPAGGHPDDSGAGAPDPADAAGADADSASGDAASTRASKLPRQLDMRRDGAGVPRHLSDRHGADVRLHPRRR